MMLERKWVPRGATDINGPVQAAVHPDNNSLLWDTNEVDKSKMNIEHNDIREVELSLSGFTLQMWGSEEECHLGIRGGRRAPRPWAWWDLRCAHDVSVEVGDVYVDEFPYRVCIHCKKGCIFFRVTTARAVALWHDAIRRVIQDSFQGHIARCDNTHLQQRRWIVAVGLMQNIQSTYMLNDLALESVFHAYDFDYNNQLETGELMLLVLECYAAHFNVQGYADCQDRDTAVTTCLARQPWDIVYDKAMHFRRRVDEDGNGVIRKDEFVRHAQYAILEAVGVDSFSDTDFSERPRPSHRVGNDVCGMQ